MARKSAPTPGGCACSNASALRGGAITSRGRGIGAPTSRAARARASSATILRGGVAGREKRERKSKNEPNEILGHKATQIP